MKINIFAHKKRDLMIGDDCSIRMAYFMQMAPVFGPISLIIKSFFKTKDVYFHIFKY
jgi:hypothetical protein